jgi:hypothetical protein
MQRLDFVFTNEHLLGYIPLHLGNVDSGHKTRIRRLEAAFIKGRE